MSTFLTGGEDEGTPRGELSEVDRQRLANADWREKYEEAVRVHGLKERENDAQLAIAKRELTRQGERAVAAEGQLKASQLVLKDAAGAHHRDLQALKAGHDAERAQLQADAAAKAAIASEELTVAASFQDGERVRELATKQERIAELEGALTSEQADRAAVITALAEQTERGDSKDELLGETRERLVKAEGREARAEERQRALAVGVPILNAQCGALRGALLTLAEEQRALTGTAATNAEEAQRALQRLTTEQQAVDAAAQREKDELRQELRAANKGTANEFDEYQAKLGELRERLVATDNEKCSHQNRVSQLERECKQLQEQMWEVVSTHAIPATS